MKLIKPSFEIIEQEPGIEGIYKIIEQAGRTCYLSTDKITEDSAKKFIEMLNVRHHLSVYEHGTVYLKIDFDYVDCSEKYDILILPGIIDKYLNNKYSKCIIKERDYNTAYITTNYRVIIENKWEDDLQYICEPTEYHEKRVTVKFICPISISREFNRHRVNSVCEQSTRYCNYFKSKFNNEITFIIPLWARKDIYHEGSIDVNDNIIFINGEKVKAYNEDNLCLKNFLYSLKECELTYMNMIEGGYKAQEAREVLNLCTATELIHTAFINDWRHFFSLRSVASAHPQAQELAIPLKEEFIKRGYI